MRDRVCTVIPVCAEHAGGISPLIAQNGGIGLDVMHLPVGPAHAEARVVVRRAVDGGLQGGLRCGPILRMQSCRPGVVGPRKILTARAVELEHDVAPRQLSAANVIFPDPDPGRRCRTRESFLVAAQCLLALLESRDIRKRAVPA